MNTIDTQIGKAGAASVGKKQQPLLDRIENTRLQQLARLGAPWAMLISALGLVWLVAIVSMDRAEQKLYREQSDANNRHTRIVESWQVLTNKAPGNSGKVNALEYLASQNINLKNLDLGADDKNPALWLVDVKLTGVDLTDVNLSGASLVRADLSNAVLINGKFVNSNLSDAELNRIDLTDANLNGANLTHAQLSEANLSRTSLEDAQMDGALLNDAILTDANLSGASLVAADLSGADLSLAHLINAEMIAVNLSNANLSGAHLLGANLIGAVLDGACGNESTSYPEGFVALPVCKEKP